MIDVSATPHATPPPRVGLDTLTTWVGKPTVCHDVTVAPPSEKRSLKPLGAIGANLRYPAGQTILREDDEADHFFEVLGGTVSISRCMADGRRQILDFLSNGDLFGLTLGDNYHYTADAVTQVIAVRYRRRDLDTRLGNNRALASHLLAAVIDELRAAQNRLLLLGCKSATEKVASFLLEMASRGTRLNAIKDHIDLPMRRDDIADYLGLTVETVSRTFSRLRCAGIIALPTPKQVVVLCAKTLYEFAEGGDPLLRTGGKPEWKRCSISPYGAPPSS